MAPGGCPPEAPTDPYVHALVHTVPQVMVSLCGLIPSRIRSTAIRGRFVNPVLESNASAGCPAHGSTTWRPASLPRVRADATTSGRPSRRTSFPSLGDTPRDVSSFASTGPRRQNRWTWRSSGAAPPRPRFPIGDDRISQVPGEPPLSVCPVLGLRQDGGSQTPTRAPHGPRYLHDEGSHGATFEAR